MTKALVIGKFLPLHRGHLYLLRTASEQSAELTVVVCSLSSEPIPGPVRVEWVRQQFPRARVLHLSEDTMPQTPQAHPQFWDIWREKLRSLHPENIDLVFSSETYGDRLAQELGARHVCVDLPRQRFPISGTQAREEPGTYWSMLSTPAQAYLNKKVLITGAESCGKSTLSAILAQRFATTWTPEYAREYLQTKLFDFNLEDLEKIAAEHWRQQQMHNQAATRIYFSDTAALETKIYAQHYLGHSSPVIDEVLQNQVAWFDLALLLTPEVQWVADDLRNLGEERWAMHRQFKQLLTDLKIPFLEITGSDYTARNTQAIQACHTLLAQPMKGIK